MQSFLAMTVFESKSYRKFEARVALNWALCSQGGFVLAVIMATV